MCQVDDGESTMRRDLRVRKPESRTSCVKCASPDVVIPHGATAALCGACFIGHATHKFRVAVAKANVVRQGEPVLAAFSGGPSSSAALALIAAGLEPEAAKKVRFRLAGVVHVDESVAMTTNDTEDDEEELRAKLEFFKSQISRLFVDVADSVPVHVTRLECAMTLGPNGDGADGVDAEDLCVNVADETGVEDFVAFGRKERVTEARSRCRRMLKASGSATSRTRAVELLRQRLLSRVCQRLGIPHLVLGTSSTRSAIGIMSDLALGRGSQIPLDVGLVDERFRTEEGVVFLRPLKDLSSKELAVYNRLRGVTCYTSRNPETMTGRLSSVQRATEEFVVGLQRDFSFTVSTICKTGEKLLGKRDSSQSRGDSCSFCQGPIDAADSSLSDDQLFRQVAAPPRPITDASGAAAADDAADAAISAASSAEDSKSSVASATRAIRVSEVISRPSSLNNADGTNESSHSSPNLDHALCLSCRVVVNPATSGGRSNAAGNKSGSWDSLPDFVVREAVAKQRRDEMRDRIKDFLIDDEE